MCAPSWCSLIKKSGKYKHTCAHTDFQQAGLRSCCVGVILVLFFLNDKSHYLNIFGTFGKSIKALFLNNFIGASNILLCISYI